MVQDQSQKWYRDFKNLQQRGKQDAFLDHKLLLIRKGKAFSQKLIKAIAIKDDYEIENCFKNLMKIRKEQLEIILKNLAINDKEAYFAKKKEYLINYAIDCKKLINAIDSLLNHQK
jgi:hypothetical protein